MYTIPSGLTITWTSIFDGCGLLCSAEVLCWHCRNTDPARIVGDVVGHFFSALVLAIVPILGYRVLYKAIGEKEVTYIFGASWVYLVLSQFWGG